MRQLLPRVSRKIELAANVVIIGSCILLAIRFFRPELPSGSKSPDIISVGTKLELKAVNWSEHEKNLVLALRQGCHFCSESAPFYQRLVRLAGSSPTVHLLAILPQDPIKAQEYLAGLRVPLNDVRQAPLASLKLSYTPMLLLVDRAGFVRKVWVGKLSAGREDDVLNSLDLHAAN